MDAKEGRTSLIHLEAHSPRRFCGSWNGCDCFWFDLICCFVNFNIFLFFVFLVFFFLFLTLFSPDEPPPAKTCRCLPKKWTMKSTTKPKPIWTDAGAGGRAGIYIDRERDIVLYYFILSLLLLLTESSLQFLFFSHPPSSTSP